MFPSNYAIQQLENMGHAYVMIFQGSRITEKSVPFFDSKSVIREDDPDPIHVLELVREVIANLDPGAYVMQSMEKKTSGAAKVLTPFRKGNNQQGAGIHGPGAGLYGIPGIGDIGAIIQQKDNRIAELEAKVEKYRDENTELKTEKLINRKMGKQEAYIGQLQQQLEKEAGFGNKAKMLMKLYQQATGQPAQQQPRQVPRQQPSQQQPTRQQAQQPGQQAARESQGKTTGGQPSQERKNKRLAEIQASFESLNESVGMEGTHAILVKLANLNPDQLEALVNLSDEDLQDGLEFLASGSSSVSGYDDDDDQDDDDQDDDQDEEEEDNDE